MHATSWLFPVLKNRGWVRSENGVAKGHEGGRQGLFVEWLWWGRARISPISLLVHRGFFAEAGFLTFFCVFVPVLKRP